MRALTIATTCLLLGGSLSGCDLFAPPQQAAQVAQPVAAPAPPPAAEPPLTRLANTGAVQHVRRHRYERGVGEQSVDVYGYVSASRTASAESTSQGDEEFRGYDRMRHIYRGNITWVDGYGRGYFQTGPARVADSMSGRRLAPYHGYDADCPDKN
jgi:hypothetical protein